MFANMVRVDLKRLRDMPTARVKHHIDRLEVRRQIVTNAAASDLAAIQLRSLPMVNPGAEAKKEKQQLRSSDRRLKRQKRLSGTTGLHECVLESSQRPVSELASIQPPLPRTLRTIDETNGETQQHRRSSRCHKRPKALEQTQSELRTTTGLNDLVLAPFQTITGKHYYWGLVTKIPTKDDSDETVHVWFEDDDFRVDLRPFELISEADVQKEMPQRLHDHRRMDWTLPKVSSLESIHENACGECLQCQAEDCGNCRGCRWNRDNNNRQPKACLLRFCSRRRFGTKLQPLPDPFPSVWHFYFTTKENTCKYKLCFCGKLKNVGLVIKCGALEWRCLAEVLHASGFNGSGALKALDAFFSEVLGIPFDQSCDAPSLINQTWKQTWIDVEGSEHTAHGKIVGCKAVVDYCFEDGAKRVYKVDLASTNDVESSPTNRRLLSSKVINEEEAYGGIITAKDERERPVFLWKTPDQIALTKVGQNDPAPSLKYLYRDHWFELFVKTSEIPNAGKGLFLKCFAGGHTIRDDLVFSPGEFLDLGVYGPQREADITSGLHYHIKSFVLDGKPEQWSFGSCPSIETNSLIDITDDLTGEVHDNAKRSIIIYANETDGEEPPSLESEYDCTGALHFLLGHRKTQLKIPVGGVEMELKVS